uniref:Uncharacterized protein n=1 Tax=Lepeophtheirus salmonis TaxID=72036 RepID=A0A0K2TPM9_LEPSM
MSLISRKDIPLGTSLRLFPFLNEKPPFRLCAFLGAFPDKLFVAYDVPFPSLREQSAEVHS